MTGYTRKKIGSQVYVLTTLVGSGRIKVSFDDGPDIAMWDDAEPDPWVSKLDGFSAFQLSGHTARLDSVFREFNLERRRAVRVSKSDGPPPHAVAGIQRDAAASRATWRAEDDTASIRPISDGLVFRSAPHDSYLVFTLLERAELIDSYHRALKAATWGQFRKEVGPSLYRQLFEDQFDEDNPEPTDSEAFCADYVPGDFPPWLAPEIEHHIPIEILRQFGKQKFSFTSGSYWHLDSSQRDQILKALEAAGIMATERADLQFW